MVGKMVKLIEHICTKKTDQTFSLKRRELKRKAICISKSLLLVEFSNFLLQIYNN